MGDPNPSDEGSSGSSVSSTDSFVGLGRCCNCWRYGSLACYCDECGDYGYIYEHIQAGNQTAEIDDGDEDDDYYSKRKH
jgi:hypothetical protein